MYHSSPGHQQPRHKSRNERRLERKAAAKLKHVGFVRYNLRRVRDIEDMARLLTHPVGIAIGVATVIAIFVLVLLTRDLNIVPSIYRSDPSTGLGQGPAVIGIIVWVLVAMLTYGVVKQGLLKTLGDILRLPFTLIQSIIPKRKEKPEPAPVEPLTAEEAATHAMQRAKYDSDRASVPLRTLDIGLVTQSPNLKNGVVRVREIPGAVEHLRPYIVLEAPDAPAKLANQHVWFDLVDSDGRVRERLDAGNGLKPGKNYITAPKGWSVDALGKLDVSGHWNIRVRWSDKPIAAYRFNTLVLGEGIERLIDADGEVNDIPPKGGSFDERLKAA